MCCPYQENSTSLEFSFGSRTYKIKLQRAWTVSSKLVRIALFNEIIKPQAQQTDKINGIHPGADLGLSKRGAQGP